MARTALSRRWWREFNNNIIIILISRATFNDSGSGRNTPLSAVRLLTTAAAYAVRRCTSAIFPERRWRRYKERGDWIDNSCSVRHQPRAPIFVMLRSHPFFPSRRTHSAAAHSRVTSAVTYRCLSGIPRPAGLRTDVPRYNNRRFRYSIFDVSPGMGRSRTIETVFAGWKGYYQYYRR